MRYAGAYGACDTDVLRTRARARARAPTSRTHVDVNTTVAHKIAITHIHINRYINLSSRLDAEVFTERRVCLYMYAYQSAAYRIYPAISRRVQYICARINQSHVVLIASERRVFGRILKNLDPDARVHPVDLYPRRDVIVNPVVTV